MSVIDECPLVKPSEGYDETMDAYNMSTFGSTSATSASVTALDNDLRLCDLPEYEWDPIMEFIENPLYEIVDSKDDCTSNASDSNNLTKEEITMWLKEDMIKALEDDNKEEYIPLFEQYINDPKIEDYFDDWGGRPASSYYEQVNYKYCVCSSEWVEQHRQLEQRKCNCVNGKRFLAYYLADQHGAKEICEYIVSSGLIDTEYEVWQHIEETEEEKAKRLEEEEKEAEEWRKLAEEDERRADEERWAQEEYEQEEYRRRYFPTEEELDEDDYLNDIPSRRLPESVRQAMLNAQWREEEKRQRRWKLERWP